MTSPKTTKTVLMCAVCGNPQFATTSGIVCDYGHGGAGSVEVEVEVQEIAERIVAHKTIEPPVALAKKFLQCEYLNHGHACCVGKPCRAEVHNQAIAQTAPAVPSGDELRKIVRSARTSASDDASPTEYVLAGWRAAMATRGN